MKTENTGGSARGPLIGANLTKLSLAEPGHLKSAPIGHSLYGIEPMAHINDTYNQKEWDDNL